MSETRFRFCALVLLAGILVCQVIQLVRPPFVRGAVRLTNEPIDVRVDNGTLDVNVENRTLDVEVTNSDPIDVKVQR